MDNFEKNLNLELGKFKSVETVTLERILNFFKYVKDNNFTASIIYFDNEFQSWLSKGKEVFEGHGKTINESLDDLLKNIK